MRRTKPRLTYAPKGMVLTDAEFEDIHKRLDRTRSTSRTATVSAEALRHLLTDHGLLYARLEEVDLHLRSPSGVKLSEPPRPVDEDEEDLIG